MIICTIFQPNKGIAYRAQHSKDTSNVLDIAVSWTTLINIFLGDFKDLTIERFSKQCQPKRAKFNTGEVLEWQDHGFKLCKGDRWIKWKYDRIEKNPDLKENWFELELPQSVQFLDNPIGLR